MTINIFDDGKKKPQSVEAEYYEDELQISGYGFNKEEAIKDLKDKIEKLVKKLNKINYNID